ncbi:MAG: META domain-containing protein [Ascidiaceihabitans sp.]|nr:META domain-containing protein [Ascidiaceihabitans sp.]
MRFVILALVLLISACRGDETLRAYGAADRVWTLTELDGKRFAARATIEFPEEGRISGQAPCNHYFADLTVPYPWFETGPIGATKMACSNLDAEAQFFKALDAMSLSEVLNNTLILSTPEGREMVFKSGG